MSETTLCRLAAESAAMRNDLKGVWRCMDEQLKLAEYLRELTAKVERQGAELQNLTATITELAGDLKRMKEQPARRWEAVVSEVIAVVISAAVGFAFAKMVGG